MGNPVPLEELKRLYQDEKLSVPEIVTRLGLTRQAVYERLRNHGITLRTSAEKPSATGLTKEVLVDLYHGQKLTTREIAESVGCRTDYVIRDLDRFDVPRFYRRASKYRYIENLAVGDQIKIVVDSGMYPTNILKTAKQLGIRIVTRKLGERTFAVYRTPLLNSETVRQMKDQGMTVDEIAKIFLATRATIARRLV